MLTGALPDFSGEDGILLLFCAMAVIAIGLFTLLRAASGQWLHAGVDAVVTAAAALAGLHLWRTGDTRLIRRCLAALFAITLVSVVYLFDADMLFWAYPTTAAMFFVLGPASAAVVNLLALGAIAPEAARALDGPDTVGLLGSLLATNLLAAVFSTGMMHSRSRFRRQARHDPLTGAGNRRALQEALPAALDKLAADGTPACLVAMDVDHFKRINDADGHDAGDRLLVNLVALIRSIVRSSDDLFRYGGEEFVLLAHGATGDAAREIAEKLRSRIAAARLADGERITVSVGVAEAISGDTPRSWFQRADAALYRAKEQGRDRVCLPGAEPDEAPGGAMA